METYKAEYECLNCCGKITVEIEKGKPMPRFLPHAEQIPGWRSGSVQQAPKCPRCGCMGWSFGKFKEG